MIRFSGTNMIKMVHTPYCWCVDTKTFTLYKSIHIKHMGWLAAGYFTLLFTPAFLLLVISLINIYAQPNKHILSIEFTSFLSIELALFGISFLSLYIAIR